MSEKNNFLDLYNNEYIYYAKKEQKPQSFNSLVDRFGKYILPFFKDKYIEDITSKDIIEWENYILTFNFSNNYNKNMYYLLSGFFEYCKKFYSFDKNIISNVGCFKKKYEEPKYDFYTLQEFNKFIKAFENDIVYKQFFTFMFYVGTRPGEALALRFSDLNNGYISITKNISSRGNREIGTPKTKSSIRKIQIDKKTEKELLALKKYYVKKYNKDEDFYIFGGVKPLATTTINRHKEKACKKAGIRSITLHQFRHSHATLLISNQMPITEVSRRLGHSKTSTTLDIYSHVDKSQEKKVYDTLNSLRFSFFDDFPQIVKKIISFIKTLFF